MWNSTRDLGNFQRLGIVPGSLLGQRGAGAGTAGEVEGQQRGGFAAGESLPRHHLQQLPVNLPLLLPHGLLSCTQEAPRGLFGATAAPGRARGRLQWERGSMQGRFSPKSGRIPTGILPGLQEGASAPPGLGAPPLPIGSRQSFGNFWGVAEGAGGVPGRAREAAEFGGEELGKRVGKFQYFGKCQGGIQENYREQERVFLGLAGNGGRNSQLLKFVIPKMHNS